MRITSWSRVMPAFIHQDVDLAELRQRRLDPGLHLLFVRNVNDESRRLASRGRDLRDQFVEFLLIARRHRDGSPSRASASAQA